MTGLAAVLCAVPLVARAALQLDLRHAGGRVSPEAAARALRERYLPREDRLALAERDGKDLSMAVEGADMAYLVDVSFGTPPQTLPLTINTGTSDIWVIGAQCSSNCGAKPAFDPSKSSSARNTTSKLTLGYLGGSASGTVFRDTLSVGGVSVENTPFLLANGLSANFVAGDHLSGILGLAFGGIAAVPNTSAPFWMSLADDKTFAIHLTRGSEDPAPSTGGTLTIGGTNSALYHGEVEYLELTGKDGAYWTLDLASMSVNGTSILVDATTKLASIDVGSTIIAGPPGDVAKLWAAVPDSAEAEFDGFYSFPCAAPPLISLSFGGVAWPISTADINYGRLTDHGLSDPTGTLCLGTIFALFTAPGDNFFSNKTTAGERPSWIIGDSFLKNVYTVFRQEPPAVGFARLPGAEGPVVPGSASPTSASPTASTSSTPSTAKKHSNAAPIAGGVVGGILLLTGILVFALLWRRRRRRRDAQEADMEGRPASLTSSFWPRPRMTLTSTVAPSAGAFSPTRTKGSELGSPVSEEDSSSQWMLTRGGAQAGREQEQVSGLALAPQRRRALPEPQVQAYSNSNPTAVTSDAGSETSPVVHELRMLREEVRRLAAERGEESPPPWSASA
ncbi:Aspartic peptidase A1 [Mycena kentingensis (nom. inval.)]|nr:Aspartic peptidase A1 [Mycena kentingensis (nom. inval.)]